MTDSIKGRQSGDVRCVQPALGAMKSSFDRLNNELQELKRSCPAENFEERALALLNEHNDRQSEHASKLRDAIIRTANRLREHEVEN